MITNVQVQLPVAAAPSAPALVPGLRATAARAAQAVWNVLHAIGEARARRELLRLAAANEVTNPELAAQLRQVVREDWLTKS